MKTKDFKLNQQQKESVVRIMANAFVKVGFGYEISRDVIFRKLNYKINAVTYGNFMTTIMRFAFRQLEDFLSRNIEKQIRPINHNEERVIRTPMMQCRRWMKEENVNTFFKFILISNKLQKIDVSVQEALSLYNQLHSIIRNCGEKKEILMQKKRKLQYLNIQKSLHQISLDKNYKNIETSALINKEKQQKQESLRQAHFIKDKQQIYDKSNKIQSKKYDLQLICNKNH